jgi:hypothetical protein
MRRARCRACGWRLYIKPGQPAAGPRGAQEAQDEAERAIAAAQPRQVKIMLGGISQGESLLRRADLASEEVANRQGGR